MAESQNSEFRKKARRVANSLRWPLAYKISSGLAVISSLLAALFWFLSASVSEPETNLDTLIVVIEKASQLSAYAAICAGVAALFAFYNFFFMWNATSWDIKTELP